MMKDRYEVTVAVPAEAVKPLLKLDKNIVRAELTINEIFFEECRYHFAKKRIPAQKVVFPQEIWIPARLHRKRTLPLENSDQS